MNKSYILYGPTGCGKTRNCKAIAQVLRLSRVLDGWGGEQSTYQFYDTLHIVNQVPDWAVGNRRVISFDDAMALVDGL
jgi:energy-coupling factor transporter ATP-binding protein EcfA2